VRSALVTGGAGFVGSHLVDALVARGTRATVLDDLSTGRWENVTPRATLIVGSVTDERAVTAALEIAEPDVVFHLAAQIDVRRAVSDPAHDAAVNLIGTVTVLEAAQRAGVRRFVLASTGGAIYGEAGIVPTPETATPHPGSPYAASKTAAEVYLDLYRELHGLSSLTLRLANVYGPRQDPRGEAGVIAIFCAAAAAGDERARARAPARTGRRLRARASRRGPPLLPGSGVRRRAARLAPAHGAPRRPAMDAHQHGSRHAPSESRFRIAMKPCSRAAGQKRSVVSEYSTT
jgi:nucleoside-diphosphate-sugar epimerase